MLETLVEHSCFYITAIKIFSMFYDSNDCLKILTERLWTWRTASTLVIDDINPGEPINEEIITTRMFLYYLNNEINKITIKRRETLRFLGLLPPQEDVSPVFHQEVKQNL